MAHVCPKCGEENPERARFCLTCATPLAEQSAPAHEQRKVVTVVFSDLTGSTSLGERLDSESLRQIMARYYATMRQALENHGGTVEKFIGDAVMAVFGIPVLHEDDALRAVRAAWEMGAALDELNAELEARWGERLQTRTGVNTGEVVAGDPAQGDSFAAGDAVNVAARFEQAAGPGEILIGEETHRLVRHAVEAEPVEPLSLKGKTEAIPAFRLLSVGAEQDARGQLDSPLVGRERELRQLRDAFEQAVEEAAPRLAIVRGPAGVGKSRLCQEFLSGIGDRATVLTGHCLPYGQGITLWPVIEVVKQAAGIGDEDSPENAKAKIAELVAAEDAALVAERVTAALALSDAVPHPEETSWALRRLFEGLAAERPLVVVFDDIHWAEPAFLELIEYLAEMTSASTLLLCLGRPELSETHPDFGTRGLEAPLELGLGPLDHLESRLLMDNLLGEGNLPRDLSERIAKAAEGNPLFVEEMLRTMVDEGKLERHDGAWQVVGELSDVDVPSTIQAVLAARLEGLEGPERTVIERAAVIGQEFWRGAVSNLSPEESRDVIPKQLEALVRKELLLRGGTPFLEDEAFRFSHLMVRDVAYSGLLKEMRAELHERFADWLEEHAGERASEYDEIIGYHLEQAARYLGELVVADPRVQELGRRAAAKLGAAGRRALARGDMAAAVNLLNRSLELLPAHDADRAELNLRLGAALAQVGELTRADEVLVETVEEAAAAGDRRLEQDALLERAFLRFFTAQTTADEAAALAKQAIPIFQQVGEELGLARACRLLSAAYLWQGQVADATEELELAFDHAQRVGSETEIAEILQWLAWARLEGPMPAEEAIDRSKQFLARAGENPVGQATHLYLSGALEAIGGRFSEAREHCARGKRIYAELGLRVRAADASLFASEVERLAGEPQAVEAELRPALDALLEIGERSMLSDVAARLALAALENGQDRQAHKLASVADNSRSRDDLIGRFTCLTVQAKVDARRGDLNDAEATAREAVELARGSDALSRRGDALACLAEVLVEKGRPDEAVPLLNEALEAYEQKGNVVSVSGTRAVLESLEGAAVSPDSPA